MLQKLELIGITFDKFVDFVSYRKWFYRFSRFEEFLIPLKKCSASAIIRSKKCKHWRLFP